MNNPTQAAAVKYTTGGDSPQTYALVFDFEAIAEAEDITGRALLTGLTKKVAQAPSINTVRAMFFAAARARQPDLTLETVKAMVTRATLWDVWNKTLEAWMSGMDDDEPASDEPDPSTGRS